MRAFTYDVCSNLGAENKFDQKQKFETGVNCPGSIVRGQLSGVKSKCYLNLF